jgi:hypothetical protein
VSAITIAAILAAVAPASANGRAPSSVKVVFRPGDTQDILLGVTFGLMVTHDDTATWRWICESAVGFQGTFDPDYEMTADGTIWAPTFDGLRYTRDGCVWNGVPQPLGTWLVTEVTVSPDGTIYAGAADPVLGSGIFKSTDNGVSWQATGDLNQVFDWFDTIEVAPSDPQKLYVTGYRVQSGFPREKLLFRSLDAGQTWQSLPVNPFIGTELSDVQIAAVSPTDPDLVFVKVTFTSSTVQETIYRTTNWSNPLGDGGPTWTNVFEVPTFINGVVVRQSGDVLVATQSMGLHRATDGGVAFSAVAGVTFEARCLTERASDQSLWMCANHLPPDLMALGRSMSGDAGTWMTKIRYEDMVGPVRCPAGNDQHDDCEVNLWCGTKDQFGVTSNEIDCSEPGADTPDQQPPPKGCCDGNAAPGAEVGVGVLGLMLLLGRRRRRRA